MNDISIGGNESAISLPAASPLRRLIVSARFLEALTRVEEERLKKTSTLEQLFDDLSADFAESSFVSIKPWHTAAFEKQFTRTSRGFRPRVKRWLEQHSIRTQWIEQITVYTLLVRLHRPASFRWSVPPLSLATTRYQRFRFEAEGYQPDFETPGAARVRLRDSFATALVAHIDHVSSKEPSRAPVSSRKEKRDLEWLALNQVHKWSITTIAHEWGLGNQTRSGGTGRANVKRTLEHWRSLLELPRKD